MKKKSKQPLLRYKIEYKNYNTEGCNKNVTPFIYKATIYLKSSPKQNEFLTLTTLRLIDSIYG